MKLVRWPPSAVKLENNSPVQVHKSPLFTGSKKNKATSPTSIAVHGKVHNCKMAPSARGHLGHPVRAGLAPSSGWSPFPQPPTYICLHRLLSLSLQTSVQKQKKSAEPAGKHSRYFSQLHLFIPKAIETLLCIQTE